MGESNLFSRNHQRVDRHGRVRHTLSHFIRTHRDLSCHHVSPETIYKKRIGAPRYAFMVPLMGSPVARWKTLRSLYWYPPRLRHRMAPLYTADICHTKTILTDTVGAMGPHCFRNRCAYPRSFFESLRRTCHPRHCCRHKMAETRCRTPYPFSKDTQIPKHDTPREHRCRSQLELR